MEYLSKGWWKEAGEKYITSLMKFLPPKVKFLITDCNSKSLLNSYTCLNSPVVRVTTKNDDPSLFHYLSDSEFKEAIGDRSYFNLKLNGNSQIMKEDDINPRDLKEVENLLSQINDS